MKRLIALTIVLATCIALVGCTMENGAAQISSEERRRIDLYVQVMTAAFQIENGGDGFVAVRLDSLEGLGADAQQEVLKDLIGLSANVYSFAKVEWDETKFVYYHGNMAGTINGTVLSVSVEEYSGDAATIAGCSRFGNLGAVFPKYRARYDSGIWILDMINMAIS